MSDYFDPYAPIDDLIDQDLGVDTEVPTLEQVNLRRQLFGLARLTDDQWT